MEHGAEVVSLDAAGLLEEALGLAAVLGERGVGPGDRVGILGPNDARWVVSACAVWELGAVAVPVAYPVRVRNLEAVRGQVRALLSAAECSAVLVDPTFARLVTDAFQVVDWNLTTPGPAPGHVARPGDPAVLQFTSGSTSAPKGALLSHGAILTAMHSVREAQPLGPGARLFSWQPLFHDMGLFMFPLRGVVEGLPVHLMTTEAFAKDPPSWLKGAARVGATALGAPPSALAVAIKGLEGSGEHPDLSAVEQTIIAAEMVDPNVIDRTERWGAASGYRREAMTVCYGLAEAVAPVTMRVGPPRILDVDGEALAAGTAVSPGAGTPKRLVSAGAAMPRIEVRIGDPRDPFEEGRVGEVLVTAESLMDRYVGPGEAEDPSTMDGCGPATSASSMRASS